MNVWSGLHQRYHLLPHPSFCTFRFSPPLFGSLHRRCPTPQINRTRSPRSKSLWVGAWGQQRSPHNELISAISTVMPLSANRKWHKRELSWCYEVNQASNNYAHRSAITRTTVPMETMVKISAWLECIIETHVACQIQTGHHVFELELDYISDITISDTKISLEFARVGGFFWLINFFLKLYNAVEDSLYHWFLCSFSALGNVNPVKPGI